MKISVPAFTSFLATAFMFQNGAAQTIVDIAVENDFNTLVTAVQTANLTDALSATDGLTVFAPTDIAFAMADVNVTQLLEDEWRAHLLALLEYHVVPDKVYSSDLSLGMTAPTLLEGAQINVTQLDPMVMINDADVVLPDIEASNGGKLKPCYFLFSAMTFVLITNPHCCNYFVFYLLLYDSCSCCG